MHPYVVLIYLVIPLWLMYLLVARGRRQRRVQTEIQSSIQPGRRVMTSSGLHATVVSFPDGDTVVLEIASGIQTTWARLAIAEVFGTESNQPESDQSDQPERITDLTASAAEPVHDRDDHTLT